jgi:hypothetical protein
MEFDREWIVPLEQEGIRILVRHGGRPMTRYAAMLQTLRDGQWRTIRLIDNAHDTHHMHRYAGDFKRDAVRLELAILVTYSRRPSPIWYGHRVRSSKVGNHDA